MPARVGSFGVMGSGTLLVCLSSVLRVEASVFRSADSLFCIRDRANLCRHTDPNLERNDERVSSLPFLSGSGDGYDLGRPF